MPPPLPAGGPFGPGVVAESPHVLISRKPPRWK